MLGELTPEQIDALLYEQMTARLGCHADGETYVVPISYAYDGEAIFGHSAEGRKVRMMRQNPEVCVEVDRVDDLAHWQSVIAWGRYEELGGAEAQRAITALVARFTSPPASETSLPGHAMASPGVPPHGAQAAHGSDETGQAAVFYRVRLTKKTGRFEAR